MFRRAYDALNDGCPSVYKADLEYLRILLLAASTMESEVESALDDLLALGQLPDSDAVKAAVRSESPEVPDLPVPEVSLGDFDELLGGDEEPEPEDEAWVLHANAQKRSEGVV